MSSDKDDGQDVRPTKSMAASPLVVIPVPVQKLIAETFDAELLSLMGV